MCSENISLAWAEEAVKDGAVGFHGCRKTLLFHFAEDGQDGVVLGCGAQFEKGGVRSVKQSIENDGDRDDVWGAPMTLHLGN